MRFIARRWDGDFNAPSTRSVKPSVAEMVFTMTVATTGKAMQKRIGWRKALRAALADNPLVKGEGLSPKARRELLGHSQLSLAL